MVLRLVSLMLCIFTVITVVIAEDNYGILKKHFPNFSEKCLQAMVELTKRSCHNWGTGEAALIMCAESYYGTHKPQAC